MALGAGERPVFSWGLEESDTATVLGWRTPKALRPREGAPWWPPGLVNESSEGPQASRSGRPALSGAVVVGARRRGPGRRVHVGGRGGGSGGRGGGRGGGSGGRGLGAVALGEGGDHLPARRAHSGHRPGRAAQRDPRGPGGRRHRPGGERGARP
ncbi:PREDICTED: translation initiation factor IF-2-like [Chinchilla lanigera]|uniref:translation initiation factor IF-2-like n=1 Tax=Chinchilla lanigera TaxID=34839 RepID=UPI0006983C67|nr:PREDICTED: translation initiation factor IF-2-like [Chinchilla lanigera]